MLNASRGQCEEGRLVWQLDVSIRRRKFWGWLEIDL